MQIRLSPRIVMGCVSLLFVLAVTGAWVRATGGQVSSSPAVFDGVIERHAAESIARGRQIFRFDAFGSEAFWGGKLRLHQPSSERASAASVAA